jgi:diaminopimelate epimerase
MSLIFEKYHGFGTDYFIFDLNKNQKAFNTDIIRFLYKGNLGYGSMGIIVGPYITKNTINFKVYNPSGIQIDNTDIESSIFFKYLKDSGYSQTVNIMANNNNLNGGVTMMEDNNMITISMGTLSFHSKDIGMNTLKGEMINIPFYFGGREYWSTCVYTDSPHLVIPMEEISAEKVRNIGKYSENAKYFSNPMNTEIVKVIDRSNIQIEMFQHGIGYTVSSVEGAIAAAGVVYKLGLVDSNLTVHMPGGKLKVNLNKDMEINVTSKISSVGQVYLLDEYIDNKMDLTY